MDGSKNISVDDLSKLTKVEELREKLVEHFDAENLVASASSTAGSG